jgi:nucleoside 2-deoxyribosyltransferase
VCLQPAAFFEGYRSHPLGANYFYHLAFDSTAFTLEALSFVVMARSLSIGRCYAFAGAALAVYLVDCGWAVKCACWGLASGARLETYWAIQDPIVVVLLLLSVLARQFWSGCGDKCLYAIVCIILILETCVDIPLNRSFYFPAADSPPAVATNTPAATVYFAGPLFSQAEWTWNASVVAALRRSGCTVFSPQEHANEMLTGTKRFDPRELFDTNLAGIERCDVVVAILDGPDPDSGTAWECGYARKSGRPVVGVRSDLRAGGDDSKGAVNLMLAQSCADLVTLPAGKRTDEAWLVDRILEAVKRARK